MSAPPYRTAETDDVRLGALVRSYARSNFAVARSLLFMGALLIIGLQACPSSLGGLEDRPAGTLVIGVMVGATAFMAALAVGFRLITSRGSHLELREHGLAYRFRQAKVVMPWDDVVEVRVTRRSLHRLDQDRCVLVAKDRHRMELTDHLQDIAEICSRVEQESVRRLVPPALASLQAGRAVAFGPFEVTKGGLTHASRQLRWSDVADAVVARGFIVVGDTKRGIRVLPKRGGIIAWAKARYDEVPNAAVFLTLVKTLKGGE